MTQVNRCLDDEMMDKIDHALGRPVNPLRESYRNRYCTDPKKGAAMFASGYFSMHRGPNGDDVTMVVSNAGRRALADHLRKIQDPHRLFVVSFEGYELNQVAKTHGEARYRKWRSISDTDADLHFIDFCRRSSVRLAK